MLRGTSASIRTARTCCPTDTPVIRSASAGSLVKHGAAYLVEALGPLGHVALVDEAISNGDVKESVGEREVGARRELQVQRRGARGLRGARVDDDERAAAVALRVDPLHDGRHRLRAVRAPEHEGVGLAHVREREGQPSVDPEREVLSCGGRGHAVSAVIVDVRRLQRDAGELAEDVGLLVGQRAAAEGGERGRAVSVANRDESLRDEIERGFPRGRGERTVGAAKQRRPQAIGVVDEIRRR